MTGPGSAQATSPASAAAGSPPAAQADAARTGLIFDVKRYSIHDGPGIRTTVFFKGCPLSCWWCHNPESRGREPFVHYEASRCLLCGDCVAACPHGALSLADAPIVMARPLAEMPVATDSRARTAEIRIVTDPALCRGEGECARVCPSEARRLVGRRVTVAELVAEIEKDRLYFDESGGGVTFSGGEPLLQWRFLLEVLEACAERDLHRVVDTTGVASPSVLRRVAALTDLFLYDLKTMDPELHRRATGVELGPVLDNLELLLREGARVRIRVPLIPGVTTSGSLERMAALLDTLPPVEGVNLLPFHRSAKDKHRRFGMPWLLESDDGIPGEQVEEWAALVAERGFEVKIGG